MKIMEENKKYYKSSFSLLRPYKKSYVTFLLIKVLIMLLQYVTPIAYLILVNDVMTDLKTSKLPFVILIYFIVFIIGTFLGIVSKYFYNRIFNLLNLKIQCMVLKQFAITEYENVGCLDLGDLKNRMTGDTGIVCKLVTVYSADIILSVLSSVILFIIMFSLSYILAGCVLLIIPLTFVFSNILGKKTEKLSDEQRKKYGEYEGALYDILSNWKEIKTNAIEDIMLERMQEQWNELAKIALRKQTITYFAQVFSRFKDFFLTQMCLYFVGGLLILNGNLTIGVLVAFMNYFLQLLDRISAITNFILDFKADTPIAKRLFEVLFWSPTGGQVHSLESKTLEILHVAFHYPDAEDKQNILRDVTITFPEKEHIALVGKSGCGKSTLAKLLMRLYPPTSGQIKIGGVDLSALTDDCLYKTMNIVMQRPHMFHGSIRDNLLLAKSTATEDELIDACKRAYIYDFIQSKPDGFESIVGENGMTFSGGQAQRLAIARLFLLDPEIVIFDEATSSLDSQSEEMVLKAIENLSKEKTVISIAHRYSTFSKANRIAVMKNGEIIATGTHEELYGNVQAYDTLIKDQIISESLA